ncbi:hypothetical protein AQUCO_07400088v1 [Aquilegia coerulea]|uniref:HPP transmembrane region domain-containing protein n=1 Tax=Aquilegia coerulea TaxID=218851 RepID=A0A2G5C9M7_AQUCA|nr:hypothetical protein AQUCO_07400088v1 [Aquilegia coerulea]
MAIQLLCNTHLHHHHYYHKMLTSFSSSSSSSSSASSSSSIPFSSSFNKIQRSRHAIFNYNNNFASGITLRRKRNYKSTIVIASSSSNTVSTQHWNSDWKPDKSASPSLSDILWPSAGGFVAMAVLGKMDQMLAYKGLSMTVAPLAAVCAVLFATPSSPGARKYNMFVSQICCAMIGVLALAFLGPGWLARSTGLAASIGFMIFTRSVHPPAAALPILFIDGAKFHHLNFWYALFPGAAGCILLCLIQQVVVYMKDNFKF